MEAERFNRVLLGVNLIMDLSIFDVKHVFVKDIYGEVHTGVADYYGADYCEHEYGEQSFHFSGKYSLKASYPV